MANELLDRAVRDGAPKSVRLEFLGPDGAPLLTLGEEAGSSPARDLPQLIGGTLTATLTNGPRRSAELLLSLPPGSAGVQNTLAACERVRVFEGTVLPNGGRLLLPQGEFELPELCRSLSENGRSLTLRLLDKWARLDGTLGGTLDGDYVIPAGTDLLSAVESLLLLDRYDRSSPGETPLDPVAPVFSPVFRTLTQTLPDGTEVSLAEAPCELRAEAGSTVADLLLLLADTLCARIGYDACGRLRVEPSPMMQQGRQASVHRLLQPGDGILLSAELRRSGTAVYNEVVVIGSALSGGPVARGRARCDDPACENAVSRIGLRTQTLERPGFYTDEVCRAYAGRILQDTVAPRQRVTLRCRPFCDLAEGDALQLLLPELPGPAVLTVQAFTRPLLPGEMMTVTGTLTTSERNILYVNS